MRALNWKNTYSVYVPEIDAEHRELFALAGELHKCLLAGADPGALQELFSRIAGHAAEHFAHEERLMRAAHYPSLAWHKRQHATAVRRVLALQERGDAEAAIELLGFLREWLLAHVQVTDRMMGAYLRNRSRAAQAS